MVESEIDLFFSVSGVASGEVWSTEFFIFKMYILDFHVRRVAFRVLLNGRTVFEFSG